jgi:hypothetical protein
MNFRKLLRREIRRMLLLSSLRLDFYRRMRVERLLHGLTWRGYMQTCFEQWRWQHQQNLKECVYKKVQTWTPFDIAIWQSDVHTPPYVCSSCHFDDTCVMKTIRYRDPEGEVSSLQHLVSHCTCCSKKQTVDAKLGFGYVLRPRASASDTYGLSYHVTFGTAYSQNRRQNRRRKTHALLWEGAEVVGFNKDDRARRYIEDLRFSNVMVDSVILDESDVLYRTLVPVIKAYEKRRCLEGVW